MATITRVRVAQDSKWFELNLHEEYPFNGQFALGYWRMRGGYFGCGLTARDYLTSAAREYLSWTYMNGHLMIGEYWPDQRSVWEQDKPASWNRAKTILLLNRTARHDAGWYDAAGGVGDGVLFSQALTNLDISKPVLWQGVQVSSPNNQVNAYHWKLLEGVDCEN